VFCVCCVCLWCAGFFYCSLLVFVCWCYWFGCSVLGFLLGRLYFFSSFVSARSGLYASLSAHAGSRQVASVRRVSSRRRRLLRRVACLVSMACASPEFRRSPTRCALPAGCSNRRRRVAAILAGSGYWPVAPACAAASTSTSAALFRFVSWSRCRVFRPSAGPGDAYSGWPCPACRGTRSTAEAALDRALVDDTGCVQSASGEGGGAVARGNQRWKCVEEQKQIPEREQGEGEGEGGGGWRAPWGARRGGAPSCCLILRPPPRSPFNALEHPVTV